MPMLSKNNAIHTSADERFTDTFLPCRECSLGNDINTAVFMPADYAGTLEMLVYGRRWKCQETLYISKAR